MSLRDNIFMFKKFLVLAMMMFCSVLWAEGDNDMPEKKTFSKDEIIKMMDLKGKLDYSYESHIDITYDLYGENKHVNRRLNKEEQGQYYKDPLAFMENLAKDDWQRAFEMSMYYQGWKPNTIFFRFDFLMRDNNYNYIPSTDDMRFKTRQVLDQSKALHWAKITYDLAAKQFELDEKDYKKESNLKVDLRMIDIIKMNLLFRVEESNLKNKYQKLKELFDIFEKSKDSSQLHPIINSMIVYCFKEKSTTRLDSLDLGKYFYAKQHFYLWRNYYTGFVYPKNKNFALMSVISSDTYTEADKSVKLETLYKISSGLYDKNDKFFKLENDNMYKGDFIRSRINLIEKIVGNLEIWSYHNIDYIPLISLYSIENLYLSSIGFRAEFSIKNPYFNKEKALKRLEFELVQYLDSPRKSNSIVKFIKYAPLNGISKEIYYEFLEKIREKLGANFCKKEDGYTQDFYNGRIPDPYEYR